MQRGALVGVGLGQVGERGERSGAIQMFVVAGDHKGAHALVVLGFGVGVGQKFSDACGAARVCGGHEGVFFEASVGSGGVAGWDQGSGAFRAALAGGEHKCGSAMFQAPKIQVGSGGDGVEDGSGVAAFDRFEHGSVCGGALQLRGVAEHVVGCVFLWGGAAVFAPGGEKLKFRLSRAGWACVVVCGKHSDLRFFALGKEKSLDAVRKRAAPPGPRCVGGGKPMFVGRVWGLGEQNFCAFVAALFGGDE